jgi:hypothetical protein
VLTDNGGRFEIKNLKPGKYALFVSKEDANYPDTASSFYADEPEIVALSDENAVATIVLRPPPQAAVIFGNIRSASSNTPVPGAQIRLIRADDPKRWLWFAASLGDAHFRELIPSGKAIQIKVQAAGYRSFTKRIGPLKANEELQVSPTLIPTETQRRER